MYDADIQLRAARDLAWIEAALDDRMRSPADRAILLQAAMQLPPNHEAWREHLARLRPLVADVPDLAATIDQRLTPAEPNAKLELMERQHAERAEQQRQQRAENRASWIQFWRDVAERPDTAFSDEQGWGTAWNLWRATSRDGASNPASGWDRRLIEELFDKRTADRLRGVLMSFWRQDHPTLPSERPAATRRTTPARWHMGLAGVYAEAKDPLWASRLTKDEAEVAARYAILEINGLPGWIDSLTQAHRQVVDAVLGAELVWELSADSSGSGRSTLLQYISYASDAVAAMFLPRLREWFDAEAVGARAQEDLGVASERLRQVTGLMLAHGHQDTRAHLLARAQECLWQNPPKELAFVWLRIVVQIDPELAASLFEDRFRMLAPGPRTEAVECFATLFGDSSDTVDLTRPPVTPQILLRLLRLAYKHVRLADDVDHTGVYRPDVRDDAEWARDQILTALLDSKGQAGWAAKLEMVDDPLHSHSRDRILAIAEERWAEEIDSVAFTDEQAVALDKTGEAPPSTNEAMFAVMRDRLHDLDDVLLGDASPREAWQGLRDEKLIRREVARELRHLAKGLYSVDQEAVTADENRTDIRLRSLASDHEATIELKRADERSARDLRDAISGQLVKKYMSAENASSGCLLVTLARDRKWRDPRTRQLIAVPALLSLLREEAQRVEVGLAHSVAIAVHFLDLRPN